MPALVGVDPSRFSRLCTAYKIDRVVFTVGRARSCLPAVNISERRLTRDVDRTLEIVPYDARWPAEFEAEASKIRAARGSAAARIDHHGSTAVPGLAAKPIIDIQVSV